MDTHILEDIGLNKSEAKVYLALLELCSSTTGPLMSKARVSSSKIYSILERLLEKGFVSFTIKNKIKHYQASSPEVLVTYIHEKQKSLKAKEDQVVSLIGTLKAKQLHQEEKQEARIFLGWKGLQSAYNHILDILPSGSDFIGFVSPTKEEERKEVKLFYLQYHKRRVENKYHTKLISSKKSRNIFEREPYAHFKRFTVRYVDDCPSGLVIFNDNILLIAFEKNPVAILIHSKEIADSYRQFFYRVWEKAP